MDVWQYNAYSQAWEQRTRDALAIEIQGAWMAAYWSSGKKHKISLKNVLKKLSGEKKKTQKPMDRQKVDKTFKQFEEILKYGWTKV